MCAWSALILLALFVFFSFALPQALQVGGGRSSGFIRGYFFLASLALLFRGTKTQIHFCCCRVFFLSFFFTFPWVARMPCQTYVVAVTTKVRLSKRVRVRRFTLSKSFFFFALGPRKTKQTYPCCSAYTKLQLNGVHINGSLLYIYAKASAGNFIVPLIAWTSMRKIEWSLKL